MKPNLQNRFAQGLQAAITLGDFGGGTPPPLLTRLAKLNPRSHAPPDLSCQLAAMR